MDTVVDSQTGKERLQILDSNGFIIFDDSEHILLSTSFNPDTHYTTDIILAGDLSCKENSDILVKKDDLNFIKSKNKVYQKIELKTGNVDICKKFYEDPRGYLYGSVNGYTQSLHLFAAYAYGIRYSANSGMTIDHKNGNKFDNRKDNLEAVPKAVNSARAVENNYKYSREIFRKMWNEFTHEEKIKAYKDIEEDQIKRKINKLSLKRNNVLMYIQPDLSLSENFVFAKKESHLYD